MGGAPTEHCTATGGLSLETCRRLIWLLQSGSLLVFSICWVAVLDYLVFMFECSWGHGNTHMHWHKLGEVPKKACMRSCLLLLSAAARMQPHLQTCCHAAEFAWS